MGLTFVGSSSVFASGNVTSQTINVTIAATGHAMFLYVESSSLANNNTTNVTGGGTWAKVGSTTNGTDLWACQSSTSSGAVTLTVTLAAANPVRIYFSEWSGQGANMIDNGAFGFSSTAPTATATSASLTTGYTNTSLLMFTGTNSGGATFTSSSGMTVRAVGNSLCVADIAETNAGAYTMSGSWNANPFAEHCTLIAVKSTTSIQVGPDFVNSGQASTGSTPVASLTTTAFDLTAGNLLVVFAVGGTISGSLTDLAGNTFQAAGANGIFFVPNCLGKIGNTVKVNWSPSATFSAIIALQYSGCDQSAPLDATAFGTAGSGTTWTSSNFSTLYPREVIIGFTYSTPAPNTPSGYTLRTNTANVNCFAFDKMVAATQTNINFSTTAGSSAFWEVVVGTFIGLGQRNGFRTLMGVGI